jgi:receptor protein-tyrosine kinase
MSRLREAFEKAAGRQAKGQADTTPAPRGADSTELPTEWDFDLNAGDALQVQAAAQETHQDELATTRVPRVVRFEDAEIADGHVEDAGLEDADADVDITEPPHALTERPPAIAQPRPRNAFWHTYRFGQKGLGKVVVGPDAESSLVEQYRRLGAALHHHQLQSGARTLMVTSAVAAEGKTLTATNLALTLSHSYQRRVLLVDADLRRPSIHEILRLPNSVGLSDSLRHPELSGLRFQKVSPNLSALTAGRADSDPMAGLVSDTMNRLLSEAAQQFDWVIVDTPPVALLPDANLLAAMIDTAVLVVSARATPYPLVRRAVEAIGQQRILGVVLNRMAKADMVAAYSYYGYGAYTYGLAKQRSRGLMFWRKSKDVQAPTAEQKSEAAAG